MQFSQTKQTKDKKSTEAQMQALEVSLAKLNSEIRKFDDEKVKKNETAFNKLLSLVKQKDLLEKEIKRLKSEHEQSSNHGITAPDTRKALEALSEERIASSEQRVAALIQQITGFNFGSGAIEEVNTTEFMANQHNQPGTSGTSHHQQTPQERTTHQKPLSFLEKILERAKNVLNGKEPWKICDPEGNIIRLAASITQKIISRKNNSGQQEYFIQIILTYQGRSDSRTKILPNKNCPSPLEIQISKKTAEGLSKQKIISLNGIAVVLDKRFGSYLPKALEKKTKEEITKKDLIGSNPLSGGARSLFSSIGAKKDSFESIPSDAEIIDLKFSIDGSGNIYMKGQYGINNSGKKSFQVSIGQCLDTRKFNIAEQDLHTSSIEVFQQPTDISDIKSRATSFQSLRDANS